MNINEKKIKNLDEKNFQKVLNHYKFNNEDARVLKSIKDIASSNIEELIEGFYEFIFEFDHAKMFLHDEEILSRHRQEIKIWYLNLFCGEYESVYFNKLNFISEVHVRIGLPAHYVNAAFSYVRRFVKHLLINEKRFEALTSWDKIIDINLDILTIAYREEEQGKLLDDILFLKSVVEEEGILPYFQPIFDSKSLKIEKYESLMRLKSKSFENVISVFPYLDIAKKIGLYQKMMKIMFSKTVKTVCEKKMEFSINLSYEDIANKDFREIIYKRVKSCDNSNLIIFEILESDYIEDFNIVEEFVLEVKKYGCQIAIDDFGSGYSSMENILKIKPDIIKIDGSLIKNIDTSKESKTIVKNIINMTRELNAKTVAEYIHSKEVYKVVNDLGVDYLQGFYLGEPQKSIR